MDPCEKLYWRAAEDAKNRKGMIVGLPKATVDVSQLEHVLRELAHLRRQNQTFRNSQKACEDCGPNEARWLPDGNAANIEAAAEDAYEWLTWFRDKTAWRGTNGPAKLAVCMAALRSFMRYDHFVDANKMVDEQ